MSTDRLRSILLSNFPFQPTAGQEELTGKLAQFLVRNEPRQAFVLRGYAGTGKTTMVRSLVKSLPAINMRSVLLAPTGRAAKVLSGYSDRPAFTIHKKIYRREERGGNTIFNLNQNLHTNTLFIIDEASMIGTSSGLAATMYEYRDLLEDLIDFVFSGKNCRLLLIGDNAQLPPVGQDYSPALGARELKQRYFLGMGAMELTEVVRQAEGSGILYNATNLRERVRLGSDLPEGVKQGFPQFVTEGYPDVIRITGNELHEELESAYDQFGSEDVIVVCRSNKRANQFNVQIRNRILWRESELGAGDLLMVVRNNYFWLEEESEAGFIANGETIEVMKVIGYRELYEHRFAVIMARLVDYPNEPVREMNILMDVFNVEAPSLGSAEMKKLYHLVAEDYLEEIPDRRKRHQEILKNPWYQALQVKFAYAVTCHKAQGGQWPVVFVDQGFLTEEMIDTEFLRWLYTAVTRSTEKLYLVNFHPDFFGDEEFD